MILSAEETSMAEAFVSFLIERIEGVLKLNKGTLLCGAKKCVKDLQSELMKTKQFLKDAEEKQMENKKISEMVDNIRRIAFKIDDKVEEYAFEVAKSRKIWIKGVMAYYKRVFYGREKKFQLEMEEFKGKVKGFTRSLQLHGVKKIMHEKDCGKIVGLGKWEEITMVKKMESNFEGFIGMESIYVFDKDMVMQKAKVKDQHFERI